MTDFYVNGNMISGTIPQCFFNIPVMRYLSLDNNQLTGSIPPITSSVLDRLKLNNNRLKGTIPESLSMLTGLATLNLGHNTIDGTIPSTLRRLTNLQLLNIENNQLSGTIPVLNQRSLQDIDLSQNYLTMGSLEAVPLSTFSPNSPYSKFIVLKSNCLVFRNPGKPSENVDATHCRGERVLPNRYCL